MRPDVANGFTLVEVLVALVISAILVTIISEGLATAYRRSGSLEQRRDALVLARSSLAEATAAPFEPDQKQGTSGKLRWTSRQTPIQIAPNKMFALVRIDVSIEDQQGRLIERFSTRRVKSLVAR